MKLVRSSRLKPIMFALGLSFVFGFAYTASASTPVRPGPVADKIQFSAHGIDQAAADIQNGNIDFYTFGIKNTAVQSLRNSKSVKLYGAPSGSVSLILNPALAPKGQLNPFSLREVRYAMNYLIDRNFIANSIYGGNAIPQVSPVSKLDYDYLTVADVVAKRHIYYDFDLGKRMIAQAMTKAGAKLVNGRWTFNGRVIRLKFIIRVEDERRDVGDAIRVNLEKAGFDVLTSYQQFSGAIFKVYTSDPKSFEWNLYTEGWGRGSADRYDFANINSMAAPWMANMPGWQIAGYWQYKNAQLDTIGKKLFTGNFSSRNERSQLYREETDLAMSEAVRLWVVTTYSHFPATKNLTGVTEDSVGGPTGMLSLRGAYVPGKTTLRVGNLWVWTEQSAWNPVGGFDDVYSQTIWKNMFDPPVINDPFTGVPEPFRANYKVTTAGPSGTMAVPASAVMWNAKKNVWEAVPAGTKAKSKVVFDFSKYFGSKWHDGQKITMADVLYDISSTFERTYDSHKKQVEFTLAATQKPLLDVFRGFRVLDNNRIEVYLNYWHFDSNYIASYANLVSLTMPWEVVAASDSLVYDKSMAAYTKTSAALYNVPWLDLAQKNDAVLVANVLRQDMYQKKIPAGVFQIGNKKFLTPLQAVARYKAALAWFAKYNHLVISDGPYILQRYDPAAQYAELAAYRDPSYPFKSNSWYRAKPADIQFVKANTSKGTVGVSLQGPGTLALRYLVADPASGAVVAQGIAVSKKAGEFEIKLDQSISKKFHKKYLDVTLLASSSATALVSEKHVQIQL